MATKMSASISVTLHACKSPAIRDAARAYVQAVGASRCSPREFSKIEGAFYKAIYDVYPENAVKHIRISDGGLLDRLALVQVYFFGGDSLNIMPGE